MTSEPVVGVSFWILEPGPSRSEKEGSASRPCSVCVKGSRGGYFSEWSQIGR